MSSFQTDAKASGTVLDVNPWHELQDSKGVAHVSTYRSLESGLGTSLRPVGIEEHGIPDEMGNSAAPIGYIAGCSQRSTPQAGREGVPDSLPRRGLREAEGQ
ncbi:hypothetical protein ACFYWX_20270 [Streptomyces sp. NPDC002888]|uniref:hypothetical protein n=1 Tax=Streptomyces sp. NPDC002888 TaxID=3364668 RepID=UPI0036BCC434